MPQEVLFSSRLFELEINYRAEAFYGDEIEVITQKPDKVGDFWIQQIYNLKSGQEVARLRSRWRQCEFKE
jgi:hypothetical protein